MKFLFFIYFLFFFIFYFFFLFLNASKEQVKMGLELKSRVWEKVTEIINDHGPSLMKVVDITSNSIVITLCMQSFGDTEGVSDVVIDCIDMCGWLRLEMPYMNYTVDIRTLGSQVYRNYKLRAGKGWSTSKTVYYGESFLANIRNEVQRFVNYENRIGLNNKKATTQTLVDTLLEAMEKDKNLLEMVPQKRDLFVLLPMSEEEEDWPYVPPTPPTPPPLKIHYTRPPIIIDPSHDPTDPVEIESNRIATLIGQIFHDWYLSTGLAAPPEAMLQPERSLNGRVVFHIDVTIPRVDGKEVGDRWHFNRILDLGTDDNIIDLTIIGIDLSMRLISPVEKQAYYFWKGILKERF